jgi:hypothetical protein
MAAVASLVDDAISGAVRTRHVRQDRGRVPAGGASSHGSKEARDERRREEGRLTEHERGQLVHFWSGFASSLGCRSAHGAVQDRLMRSPPSISRVLEDAIVGELEKRGRQGAPREKLVEILAAENVGATRYEARRTMRGMMGAGRLEFFVIDLERKNPETGIMERVPSEMARLSATHKLPFPAAVSRAEKWARADAELQAFCNTISCGDDPGHPGSRTPPTAHFGAADAVGAALAAMGASDRQVLERAYGRSGALGIASAWQSLGEDVARVAPLCPTVELARQELVVAASTPATRGTVDRTIRAHDALASRLDAAPADEREREKWRVAREAFVAKVGREAQAILKDAVQAYRNAKET